MVSINPVIIPVKNIRFKLAAIILAAWGLVLAPMPACADGTFLVARVIDGDTLVLTGGTRVRLLGIDTPEVGEPWAEEATRSLQKMAMGKMVTLKECARKDPYGRTLAVLQRGGVNINISLLKEGLAVPLLIPPCGALIANPALLASGSAIKERKGIYSSRVFKAVKDRNAGAVVGRRSVVLGRIRNIHHGRKVVHLNFGDNWRTDFTIVLFSRGIARFASMGLNPEDLLGRTVYVLGKVQEYDGPEIIVNRPEQILPVYDDPAASLGHTRGRLDTGGAP